MSQNIVEYVATGRRKNAVARVRMMLGVGKLSVNGREFTNFFPSLSLQNYIQQPLTAVNAVKKFDMIVNVSGGGVAGQAGAMRHGIARALLDADPNNRPVLKAGGFLTRDPRMKERKKSGQPGARRRFQFSKR